jgi:hypothetical protein
MPAASVLLFHERVAGAAQKSGLTQEMRWMDVNDAAGPEAVRRGGPAAEASQCESCARFIGSSETDSDTGRCEAFDKIPQALWSGRVSHTTPHPGDRGLRFKPWK